MAGRTYNLPPPNFFRTLLIQESRVLPLHQSANSSSFCLLVCWHGATTYKTRTINEQGSKPRGTKTSANTMAFVYLGDSSR